MLQQQTKLLPSWEGPPANGCKGVSKEGGWDVEGGAEGGKENKTGRLSRRSGGVKAFSMGEVEMWKYAGREGRCAAGARGVERGSALSGLCTPHKQIPGN